MLQEDQKKHKLSALNFTSSPKGYEIVCSAVHLRKIRFTANILVGLRMRNVIVTI
jgi:hypothetical protein